MSTSIVHDGDDRQSQWGGQDALLRDATAATRLDSLAVSHVSVRRQLQLHALFGQSFGKGPFGNLPMPV
jgi:hypothetical protein